MVVPEDHLVLAELVVLLQLDPHLPHVLGQLAPLGSQHVVHVQIDILVEILGVLQARLQCLPGSVRSPVPHPDYPGGWLLLHLPPDSFRIASCLLLLTKRMTGLHFSGLK